MPNFNSQELVREHCRRHNLPYSIRLQSIGMVPAVFVSEISVGDVLVWNFGSLSEVVAIEPISDKFVKVTTRYKNRGMDTFSEYSQRMKLDRLVAVHEGSINDRLITFRKINRGNSENTVDS